MKIYYYAYTGHKYGLDRARRATVILKKLNEKGFNTMLLVNDFRAGLAMRDFGILESINIEGIQDIDAIAQTGDVVIIDSPEDDHGRLVKYCSDFKQVFRFAEYDDDKSIHGEIMLTVDCKKDEECISSIIVDDIYFETHEKIDRTLFFLGDSDSDKILLKNSNFFIKNPMELLLGNYFYVKYEDDLKKIFTTLYEPEEYIQLICSSKRVITASLQTAIEASVAGAEVFYLSKEALSYKNKELLKLFNIILIISLDEYTNKQLTIDNVLTNSNYVEKSETVVNKIINLI